MPAIAPPTGGSFPPECRGYTGRMAEFMWWKLGVFGALAFAWGLYCGFTGRPMTTKPEPPRDRTTTAKPDLTASAAQHQDF